MPNRLPDNGLRKAAASLADPLDALVAQLGVLGIGSGLHMRSLADLTQSLGLGFAAPRTSAEVAMAAGLALVAELPRTTFPSPVLPGSWAGRAGAASPLLHDPGHALADLPGIGNAPAGYEAIEALAARAGLVAGPSSPGSGAAALPMATLAGMTASPGATGGDPRFGGVPETDGAAASFGRVFDLLGPYSGMIDGAPGNPAAAPARVVSLDDLLSSFLAPAPGQQSGGPTPPTTASRGAAPTLTFPDLALALPDNIMAAALAGPPMHSENALGPALPPSPLLPGEPAQPGPASPLEVGLPGIGSTGDLPYSGIAGALQGLFANGSPGSSAAGRDQGIGDGAFPSLRTSSPGDLGGDSRYAGGLSAEALAGLLPQARAGSRGTDGGPDLPQASSTLARLFDPPARDVSSRSSSGWSPRPGAPIDRRDDGSERSRDRSDKALGQGRGSQPPNVFLDHRLLERLVLDYVDSASSGPATSTQRPDPRIRMPPGTAFAAS